MLTFRDNFIFCIFKTKRNQKQIWWKGVCRLGSSGSGSEPCCNVIGKHVVSVMPQAEKLAN